MMLIQVYVDDDTEKRLRQIAKDAERSVEDFAECAVAEAALDIFRGQNDDPAKQ